MVKRIVSLSIAVILLLSGACLSFANTPVETAVNGVVRVIGLNSQYISSGSGFAIGKAGEAPQVFITNNHVVEGFEEDIYIVLDHFIITEDRRVDGTLVKAEVVKSWSSPDLAILVAEKPIAERIPLTLCPSGPVSIAEDVYALGFPGAADSITDDGYAYPSQVKDVSVTRGVISKLHSTIDGNDCFQIDATIHHGNSGGPLINKDGLVIGINTFGAVMGGEEKAGVNYSIYSDYIINYLDQTELAYDKVDQPVSGNKPVENPGQEPQSPAPTPITTRQPESHNQPSSPSSDSTLLIIAGLAGVGALIGFYLKSRKTGSRSTPPASSGPERPLGSMATVELQILCTEGVFKDNSFKAKGSILMGRDPKKCQIVFPKDTPGISSTHCELKAEGGALVLIDRQSSYGTFLGNGARLDPNQPFELRPGDVFYLANRKNTFKVIRP